MRRTSALLGCAIVLLLPAAAPADDAALLERIQQLESRVAELEQERAEGPARAPQTPTNESSGAAASWTDRVQLSGSASVGYFAGPQDSVFENDAFRVWDARLFVDADLGRDVRLGGSTLVRDVGFSMEWNLARLGYLSNDVGELYVDFQGIADSDWLSLQVGRFQLPVGEAYLRRGRGERDNPFVTQPVAGAWWWNNGVRFYGASPDRLVGYVASVTNSVTAFEAENNQSQQFSLKLFTNPTPWLHLSVSGLRSGQIGSSESPASGSLWLGETWARPVGHATTLPTFTNGVVMPTAPNELSNSLYYSGDAIVTIPDAFRLWLSFGRYSMHSSGPSLYDRDLDAWIAELILEGGLLAPVLRPFYLAVRASGLGTYNDDKGYLLDSRLASRFGYDTSSLDAYSLAAGWRLTPRVTLRAEYTLEQFDLVRGARMVIPGSLDDNLFALAVGVDF